ncbi:MAG: arginine N-succinyltransferase, partial [Brevundimonas sp.]
PALISTDSIAAFRAVRAKADIDGDTVRIGAETAAALKVGAGHTVRVKS